MGCDPGATQWIETYLNEVCGGIGIYARAQRLGEGVCSHFRAFFLER